MGLISDHKGTSGHYSATQNAHEQSRALVLLTFLVVVGELSLWYSHSHKGKLVIGTTFDQAVSSKLRCSMDNGRNSELNIICMLCCITLQKGGFCTSTCASLCSLHGSLLTWKQMGSTPHYVTSEHWGERTVTRI